VVLPEERLPAGQTIIVGLQHVFTMFGSTVVLPIFMGFDPNVAILFSGVGTLIFIVAVGSRIPSYLTIVAASGGGTGLTTYAEIATRSCRSRLNIARIPSIAWLAHDVRR
jgi:xanthine/uracil permease